MARKLTAEEKYRQLKAQTESAGMRVVEENGRIVVRETPRVRPSKKNGSK